MTRTKTKLAQEFRTTTRNGNKCRKLILTHRRNIVAFNILCSELKADRNSRSLWWLRKIKGKRACSKKEDVHTSYKSGRKVFNGHDWPIPRTFYLEPLLAWLSR